MCLASFALTFARFIYVISSIENCIPFFFLFLKPVKFSSGGCIPTLVTLALISSDNPLPSDKPRTAFLLTAESYFTVKRDPSLLIHSLLTDTFDCCESSPYRYTCLSERLSVFSSKRHIPRSDTAGSRGVSMCHFLRNHYFHSSCIISVPTSDA